VALFAAPALSVRLGKKRAGITVAAIAFVGSPMPMLLRLLGLFPANGTDALFYTLLIFGAVEITLIIIASILISAMVADVVEDSELRTGRRSEGVFFAARSFAQKAVHGIGTFAATMILTAIEFPQNASPGEVAPEIVRNLGLVYVPVLLVVYLAAITLLTGYRISRESHGENLRRLAGAGVETEAEAE
jgi:Na+/melibiose symporter-like transporter